MSNIRAKLMVAVQRYAMANLKGFSETSATHYYQLRKAAVIYKENKGRIPYSEILQMICCALNITEKTALQLLQEMDALDNFQWYTNTLGRSYPGSAPFRLSFAKRWVVFCFWQNLTSRGKYDNIILTHWRFGNAIGKGR